MRHEDDGLPMTEFGISEPTPTITAWQDQHVPTLTLKVWVTDRGRQIVVTRWAKELPAKAAELDHGALHEMAEATACAQATLLRVGLELEQVHDELVMLENVVGQN